MNNLTQNPLGNFILDADSYKLSHPKQYPPGTTEISDYIEPRGGDFPVVVAYGYQPYLMQLAETRVTRDNVDEAESILVPHGIPFERGGWDYLVDQHDGRPQLRIEALPEGMVVPVKNAVVQVANTDDKLAFMTGHIETALLRAAWYGSTVATLSWHIKQIIRRYLEATGTVEDLEFKLQDFGARGVSSHESSMLGGMAHLVNFQGTDNLAAIMGTRRFYKANMPGFSIPAAEHSTITSWGREHEMDAYANMLDTFLKTGKLVAVVSDSYDLDTVVDYGWGERFKEQIMTSGGTLVVRPDSGNPVEIVPRVIQKLMNKFGYALNSKGYAVLPKCIRVIQGDGVNIDSIEAILLAMKKLGMSADNIAFGMGGALLQGINRDTMKWAMKCSSVVVHGKHRDVYKDPATDRGKTSKKGVLAVVADDEQVVKTIRKEELNGRKNLLEVVYENGKLLREWNFDEVRARAERGLRTL